MTEQKKNKEETLQGKTISDYANELDFMTKERNYWFGQAHRNYTDCEEGHKVTAIREFLPEVEQLLLALTSPSFDLNHKPVIILNPNIYDEIKNIARKKYPGYSDLF